MIIKDIKAEIKKYKKHPPITGKSKDELFEILEGLMNNNIASIGMPHKDVRPSASGGSKSDTIVLSSAERSNYIKLNAEDKKAFLKNKHDAMVQEEYLADRQKSRDDYRRKESNQKTKVENDIVDDLDNLYDFAQQNDYKVSRKIKANILKYLDQIASENNVTLVKNKDGSYSWKHPVVIKDSDSVVNMKQMLKFAKDNGYTKNDYLSADVSDFLHQKERELNQRLRQLSSGAYSWGEELNEDSVQAILANTPMEKGYDLLGKVSSKFGVELPSKDKIKDIYGKINSVADTLGMGMPHKNVRPSAGGQSSGNNLALLGASSNLALRGMPHKDVRPNSKKVIIGKGFTDFFKSIKQDYNNVSKNTLAKYGNHKIQSITVIRVPIMKVLNKVFDVLTFNKWSDALKKYNYEDMYHLGLKIDFLADRSTNVIESVIVEKNEVLNISTTIGNFKDQSQSMIVPMKNKTITLNGLMSTTLNAIGSEKMFLYNGISTNCQVFCVDVLLFNGLLNKQIETFIKQDAEAIFKELPEYTKTIMNVATNLGSRINQTIGGSHSDMPHNSVRPSSSGVISLEYIKKEYGY
jgi:hypothetical protein